MSASLNQKDVSTEWVQPAYWKQACIHLSKRDRIMRRLIAAFPDVCLESRGDAFVTLARSIVGQQISVKAAQTIWDRFEGAMVATGGAVVPASVRAVSDEALRQLGLSKRKIQYIQDLCLHFEEDLLNIELWSSMTDEEVIKELIQIKGIGRWTAEMFLMFHLLRPNVLPLDDVGLLRGISTIYFSGEPVNRVEARELGETWAPYRSVAVWYIWRSLDPLPVAY